MARFERDDSWSRAAVLIITRVRSSAEFATAIEAGRSAAYEAFDTVKNLDPLAQTAYLRERGGWSKIINSAIAEAAPADPIDGSPLLGQYSVLDVLSPADVAEIRASVVR